MWLVDYACRVALVATTAIILRVLWRESRTRAGFGARVLLYLAVAVAGAMLCWKCVDRQAYLDIIGKVHWRKKGYMGMV